MTAAPTARQLADALEINRTFAWEVVNGRKSLSDRNLVRAWRENGWKLGKLADLSDEDADTFARMVDATTGEVAA